MENGKEKDFRAIMNLLLAIWEQNPDKKFFELIDYVKIECAKKAEGNEILLVEDNEAFNLLVEEFVDNIK